MIIKKVDPPNSINLEAVVKYIKIANSDTANLLTSKITSKGGLLVGSGAGEMMELPIGADGYVPIANSNEAGGILWSPNFGLATMTNKRGSSVSQGAVVVLDPSYESAFTVTTTAGDPNVIGVTAGAIDDEATGLVVLTSGVVQIQVTGAVSVGDALCSSTTAEMARTAAAGESAFAMALTANSSGDGIVTAILIVSSDDLLADAGDPSWTTAVGTWTYASATTVTVPSGAASLYAVGDRVKFTQSGSVKYFVVVGVASTTLTLTGGTSYSVANAAITGAYYSHMSSPVGFPDTFAWDGASGCNPQGFSALTNEACEFAIHGRLLTIWVNVLGASNSTAFTMTLPVAPAFGFRSIFRGRDNSSVYLSATCYASGNTTLTMYPQLSNGGSWTASNNKGMEAHVMTYMI